MPQNRNNKEKELICNFCGKSQDEVERMIIGPGVNICNECIELCYSLLDEEGKPDNARRAKRAPRAVDDDRDVHILTPAQIKERLDQYVIGQDNAKIVLAVAVYNHYKRILSVSLPDRMRL